MFVIAQQNSLEEALEEQFMYGKRLSFDDVFDLFSSVEDKIGDLEDVVFVDDGKPHYSVSKENANVLEAFDETPQSTFSLQNTTICIKP